MLHARPSYPGDTWLLLPNLRPEEVAEFDALGITSEACIRYGIILGNAQTLFIGEEPAGILGFVEYDSYTAPWAVFTKAIDAHPMPFLRFTKRIAQGLRGPHQQYVDVRNTRAVKWFAWMGFAIDEPVPYGVNGELFHPVRLN